MTMALLPHCSGLCGRCRLNMCVLGWQWAGMRRGLRAAVCRNLLAPCSRLRSVRLWATERCPCPLCGLPLPQSSWGGWPYCIQPRWTQTLIGIPPRGSLSWTVTVFSCRENTSAHSPHGRRSPAGYSPQGGRASDTPEVTQHACRTQTGRSAHRSPSDPQLLLTRSSSQWFSWSCFPF